MSDNVTGYSHDLYHKYLMSNWEISVYPLSGSVADFRSFWFAALHDGVAVIKAGQTEKPALIFLR
ncbi:hypothetical protein MASR1M45_08960 [Candidatus Kapaibacterium sp.]